MTYTIRMTDNTHNVSEFLPLNIAGLRFMEVRFMGDGTVRGYVAWMEKDEEHGKEVLHKRGPVTLRAEDLEKI